MKPSLVAPSILAADFGRLLEEVAATEAAGADWLHLDVMDGHFVDNISFGPAIVGTIRQAATRPCDVHLMIDRPDHFLPRFLPHAANITVHVEAPHPVAETLAAIVAGGCTAGIALNPATPIEAVEPFLDRIDLLLVMTVHPGFGGQPFRFDMLEKIRAAAALREASGLDFHIEVDGGIDIQTAALCREAGANVFVAGTSFFRAPNRGETLRAIRGDLT